MAITDADLAEARMAAQRADEIRCRYEDCAEKHPVIPDYAENTERVTCESCRKYMGLPSHKQPCDCLKPAVELRALKAERDKAVAQTFEERHAAAQAIAERDQLKVQLEHVTLNAEAFRSKAGEIKSELDALRNRLHARAAFIKALAALSDNAAKLVEAWEKLPPGESLGGYPESFDTFEGFAFEIAEWHREQSAEWLCDPLGEEK